MSDASTSRDYHSISDMPQISPGNWRKFFVVLSGKTNNTHAYFVKMIKNNGHTEVTAPEECDYCVLFCPITSRVGTDVGLSLRHIPENKPTILVVMYHTFDRNHVLPDSRGLTDDPRVHLKVSCLFYEQKLLSSNCNGIAEFEIQKFLGFPQNSSSISRYLIWPVVFLLRLLNWLCCRVPARLGNILVSGFRNIWNSFR